MTEPMKTAIEYLAHELSIKTETIEENPDSTLTVEECQRVMNGYAAQQVLAERERIKSIIKQVISEASYWTNEELFELIDSL